MQVEYLGLADLGKTVTADPGQVYQQVFLKQETRRVKSDNPDDPC